ncbi:DNA polymerase beta superfamily protein [Ligilactobacillus equi]|uniref:DNA polymerase beta superfamily protein n=1 Tax=Ligilactobacillus equi TaxID=137357 RepID=UPI0003F8944C|nr:nucleotidyltransferase domain-containing protein [Ligilactobacillus equi]
MEKLKKIKELLDEKQLIGLFLTGSTLYNAKLDDNQETDYIAVVADVPQDFLTGKFVSEQLIEGDVDIKIYSFRQFVQLVLKGNPNILELFVDKSCLLYATDQFKGFYDELIEFVFEMARGKLLKALLGMAFSNLKRVKNSQEKTGKSVFNVLKNIQYINQITTSGKIISVDFSNIKNVKQKEKWTVKEIDDLEKQIEQTKQSCNSAVEKLEYNSDLVDKFNIMSFKFLQTEVVPTFYVQITEFIDSENKREGNVAAFLSKEDALKSSEETKKLLKGKDDISEYQVNVYEFDS